jgi:hypothetical protein
MSNFAKQDVQPYTKDQAKAEFGPANADLFWYFEVPGNTLQIPKSRFGTQDEAMNYVLTEKKVNPGGVPDAPFKDTWHQLAFKRAIKEAVDKGYDRIGLTTGAQQADRFDLSKQVDAVSYHPDDKGRGMMLNVFGKNNEIIYSKLTPEDKVADVIGKETAKKLLSKEAVDENRMLEGLDLKVGGEGMKKYYDEIYPNYLNKFGKKYGSQVGETRIKTGRGVPGGDPVRYLDITPEMRDAVKKGQPLASITNHLANSMA